MTHGSAWKKTGWYYVPRSASDVMTSIARIGTHGSNHRFAWRGLSNCNFDLMSSLHRLLLEEDAGAQINEDAVRTREEQILEAARVWGLGVEGGQSVDDLQLLADLQHFGIPTRLIDVTSNPMTALWFACQQAGPSRLAASSKTGLLLAINMPWYQESRSAPEARTVFKTVGEPPKTYSDFLQGLSARLLEGLKLDTPFIVSSSVPNPRLRAQEGYFLASRQPDHSHSPIASLSLSVPQGDPDKVRRLLAETRTQGLPPKLPFVAIFIPSKVKQQLLTYLRLTYSRTPKVLFPDFPGFREHGTW